MSSSNRAFPVTSILACIAIACAIAGGYVGGYFWLGAREDVLLLAKLSSVSDTMPPPQPVIVRRYKSRWLITLYQPVARLESAVQRKEVMVMLDD
jgi:hypothetical protein